MSHTANLLKHIIKSRKSTFPADYTQEPIAQEIIDDLLDVATYAPNHESFQRRGKNSFRN